MTSPSNAEPPEGIKNMRKYLGLPLHDLTSALRDLPITVEIKASDLNRYLPYDTIDQILALFQAHQQELLGLTETDRYDLLTIKQRQQLIEYHSNCVKQLEQSSE